MKTAISLPDDVFKVAEGLARRARKSRSQLYTEALREYVARHSPDDVTAGLDRVVADAGEGADAFVAAASARTLGRAEW